MGGSLFAMIFAGVIILILLIAGQLYYEKSPKTGLIVWGLTILILLYFVYIFSANNTHRGDRIISKYVGTYHIDINNSVYDSVDVTQYSDLKLFVNPDKTFTFSYRSPFFKDTIGYWQHMDDGDIFWTEITIGDLISRDAQVDKEKWIFSGHELANRKNSNSIVFVR